MRQARVRALLCGFLRSGHLFFPDLWTCSELFKSEWGILFGWIEVSFDYTERSEEICYEGPVN